MGRLRGRRILPGLVVAGMLGGCASAPGVPAGAILELYGPLLGGGQTSFALMDRRSCQYTRFLNVHGNPLGPGETVKEGVPAGRAIVVEFMRHGPRGCSAVAEFVPERGGEYRVFSHDVDYLSWGACVPQVSRRDDAAGKYVQVPVRNVTECAGGAGPACLAGAKDADALRACVEGELAPLQALLKRQYERLDAKYEENPTVLTELLVLQLSRDLDDRTHCAVDAEQVALRDPAYDASLPYRVGVARRYYFCAREKMQRRADELSRR